MSALKKMEQDNVTERSENSIRGRTNSKCKGLLVGANFERSRKRVGKATVTDAEKRKMLPEI